MRWLRAPTQDGRPLKLAFTLCLLAAALPARAGDVAGHLRVATPHRQFTRRTAAGDTTLPRLVPVDDAVVYLDRMPPKLAQRFDRTLEKQARARAKSGAPAVAPTMGQRDGAFVPHTLWAAAGTTVTFENRDTVYHSVFCVTPAQRFDLGKYAPGERRQRLFTRPGPAEVFCDIDPDETGFVFVTPNAAACRPAADGAFELRRLPAGRYTLRVWHPKYGSLVRQVDVPRRGAIELTLEY